MNLRNIFLRALPYVVAVVLFGAISTAYFAPQYSGKSLSQTDVQMYDGMKRDISEHRAAFDEDPQWTGGMFGGMPAYLISVQYPAMFLRNAGQWAMNLVGEPAALLFLAMLGFWVMLLLVGVNPWVAIVPAIAYGLSTYNILIIEAGHITKMRAMGWAPMLVGAVFWTFRRNMLIGGGLSALFGALTIAASHHQITYYFLLIVLAFWLGEFIVTARQRGKKAWRRFCTATAVLAGSALLAVGANFTHLWYTFEHSPETIRGGSEVAPAVGNEAGSDSQGLDLQYATAWSYGIGESLNMFIPNFRGGGSSGGFDARGEVANVLRRSGINPSLATQLPGYWGGQPFTGGPTYIGAVVVFLFVLGLFVLPGRQKWWVVVVSALGLLLAWGSNAMWFTQLSFSVLPGYNKFRTVAMALVVLQWAVPFVAALVLKALWDNELDKNRFKSGFLWTLGLTGGVALLFALFGGAIYDFSALGDEQFAGIPGLVDAMRSERAAMFRNDCWRSLLFVALTAGVVWLWVRAQDNKLTIRRWWFVLALGILVLADLLPVNLRYLSHDDFRTRERVQITADAADRAIMADPEPGFRVLNTENPFNEALTSYFHRSVGGYHGAKLRRYQDVIDRYLSKLDLGALNMLNTKYFIIVDPETGERQVELNPDANGAAWFVENVIFVDGAREELDALGTIDNKHQAVVDKRFSSQNLRDNHSLSDSTKFIVESTISLVEYRPNYLKYNSVSENEGLVVFSEIYYDKGWKAYIDGKETPYIRADYLLRAMVVPAGEHTIEWRFRAPHFATVEGVTLAASIAILLWLAVAVFLRAKGRLKNYGTGR